jgi:6-phosphogluconolactonase
MDNLRVFDDKLTLAEAAAETFVEMASSTEGIFTVALPGGSTPMPLYEKLASYNVSARINWAQVHVFFGDERAVPPTHDDSNYGQAQTALLSHVPIPLENVHRVRGELGADEAAKQYGLELQAFFDGGPPAFDLHILGMGDDGHTASLFPNQTASLYEKKHRAVSVHDNVHPHPRITMTPWAISSALNILVLVSGAKKADMLRTVLQGPHQPDTYPIQHIQPDHGMMWYVDREAAAKLQL